MVLCERDHLRFYIQGSIANSEFGVVYIQSTNPGESDIMNSKEFRKEIGGGGTTRKYKAPEANIRWEARGTNGISPETQKAADILERHGYHREGGEISLHKSTGLINII